MFPGLRSRWRIPLPCPINHAHAAAPDFLQDFVIAEVPLLIRHVGFGEYAFKNRPRHLANSFKSLAQEATHANSSAESRCYTALLAFRRALGRTRERVREPVRILHQIHSVSAARAAQRCRISSSTSAGFSTVCATSSRNSQR